MQDSTKKRGRPRNFDPDAALSAAAERFRARGYAGTSLDDLAAATRLNRPSLYGAFGDKKALYLAALERTAARAARGFDGLIEANLPLRAMLERLFAAVIDGYMTGENGPAGCIAINTAATEAVGDPDLKAFTARFVAMEDAKIAALLRQAGSPSPQAHAGIVTAVIHSLSVRARAGAPRAELDRLAADCIGLVAPVQGTR